MLQLSCSRNISLANNKKVKTSFSFPVVCLVIFSIHVVDLSKHSKYLAVTLRQGRGIRIRLSVLGMCPISAVGRSLKKHICLGYKT